MLLRSQLSESKFRTQCTFFGATIVGPYVDTNTRVQCLCINNHQCSPLPRSVINGGGICRDCSGNNPSTAARKFENLVNKQGGKVVGKYIHSQDRVECICLNGHRCNPFPVDVNRNRNMCSICTGSDPVTAGLELQKKIAIMGGKLIGKYHNTTTKIECLCSNGHTYYPQPYNINKGGGICSVCYPRDPILTEARFHNRVNQLGGQVTGKYKNNREPVSLLCRNGHFCSPKPSNVLSGQGVCQTCNESRGERLVAEILQSLGIAFVRQYRLPGYPNRPYDFGTYCGAVIEYDGWQHFNHSEDHPYLKSAEDLRQRQRIDAEKTTAVIALGCKVVRIDHTWIGKPLKEISDFIIAALYSQQLLCLTTVSMYQWIVDICHDP